MQNSWTQCLGWRRQKRTVGTHGLTRNKSMARTTEPGSLAVLSRRMARYQYTQHGTRGGSRSQPEPEYQTKPTVVAETSGETWQLLKHPAELCPSRSEVLVTQSRPTLHPHGLWPTRLLCPWGSPGKNTGGGRHAFLQGIFLTQGSNLCLLWLLHWQVISLSLCHLGIPSIIRTNSKESLKKKMWQKQ